MRAIEAGTTSEKKWTLIRQQQRSGLSVSIFCRVRGFSDQASTIGATGFPSLHLKIEESLQFSNRAWL
jgi:hypothetical protein